MSMKNLWAMALASAFAASAAAAELKIATVDLEKVFAAHPQTQSAEADLKAAEDAIDMEMQKMVADARALGEQVAKLREEARSPILSDEARQKKRSEAEEKQMELEEFQLRARRTQESKLKQLREQLLKSRQGIVDELLEAVGDFGREEGYDLVLDRSGMTMNMIPLAVYSRPELDVTDRLIERLKAAKK